MERKKKKKKEIQTLSRFCQRFGVEEHENSVLQKGNAERDRNVSTEGKKDDYKMKTQEICLALEAIHGICTTHLRKVQTKLRWPLGECFRLLQNQGGKLSEKYPTQCIS